MDVRRWLGPRPGWDCADFAAAVLREEFGVAVSVPSRRASTIRARDAQILDAAAEVLAPVEVPVDGDVLLMRALGRQRHVGHHIGVVLTIDGRAHVLHLLAGLGGCLHTIDALGEAGLIATTACRVRGGELPPLFAGDDSDPLRTTLQIALLVATIATGGSAWFGGLALWQQAATLTAIQLGGNLVINALAPMPETPFDEGAPVDSRRQFSLGAGNNRSRPQAPMLVVLGRHRVFPDIVSAGYREFISAMPAADVGVANTQRTQPPGMSDEQWEDLQSELPQLPETTAADGETTQVLSQIFDFGLGDLAVTDVRIGQTPVGEFGDAVTQQWSAADGTIDLVDGNVDTAAGAPLLDRGWVVRVSPADTVRLELDFTARLFGVDGSRIVSRSVDVDVEFWPSSDVTLVRAHTLTLTHATTNVHRVTVPYRVSADTWHVRVRRTTLPIPASDQRTDGYDDVVWTTLRSHQRDTTSYRGRTRLAVRARASSQLSGRMDRLSGVVQQRVPVWDPESGEWAVAPTSNPAWLFRWLAVGVRVAGELVAGAGLGAAQIDDGALQSWGAWCDRMNLACNWVLDRQMTIADALRTIAACGRGAPTWASGRLGVVWDAPAAPTAMVTPGNVVAGTLEIDWDSEPVAEEIAGRHIDADADWQIVEVRRAVPGGAPADRVATIDLPGVTAGAQAAQLVNLQAARQRYHRRRVRWEMGPEGRALVRGRVVSASHALLDGGVTGRVVGIGANVTLDRAISVPRDVTDTAADWPGADEPWMAFRLPDGAVHATAIRALPGAGDVDAVMLVTPLPAVVGDERDILWRYYFADRQPRELRIVSMRPLADGNVELTAIDEVAAYHAAATSDLTIDLPPLARHPPRVDRIAVTETLVEVAGGVAVELTANLSVSGAWAGGRMFASVGTDREQVVAHLATDETSASWIVPATGSVAIRAEPTGDGIGASVTHEIAGVPTVPAAPTGLVVEAVDGGYRATWDVSTDIDYAATEILEAPSTALMDLSDANAVSRGRWTGTTATVAAAPTRVRVWARHINHRQFPGAAASAEVTPADAKFVVVQPSQIVQLIPKSNPPQNAMYDVDFRRDNKPTGHRTVQVTIARQGTARPTISTRTTSGTLGVAPPRNLAVTSRGHQHYTATLVVAGKRVPIVVQGGLG